MWTVTSSQHALDEGTADLNERLIMAYKLLIKFALKTTTSKGCNGNRQIIDLLLGLLIAALQSNNEKSLALWRSGCLPARQGGGTSIPHDFSMCYRLTLTRECATGMKQLSDAQRIPH